MTQMIIIVQQWPRSSWTTLLLFTNAGCNSQSPETEERQRCPCDCLPLYNKRQWAHGIFPTQGEMQLKATLLYGSFLMLCWALLESFWGNSSCLSLPLLILLSHFPPQGTLIIPTWTRCWMKRDRGKSLMNSTLKTSGVSKESWSGQKL